MKKTFNVTIAITVESESEIEDIRDIDFDVEIKSKDAKIKVIDIPESYEVLIWNNGRNINLFHPLTFCSLIKYGTRWPSKFQKIY